MRISASASLSSGNLRILLLVVALFFAGYLQDLDAQGLPASLSGIVTDQSKAVVPGATIILKHEGTGALRRTVSNADGYFSIVGIPASTYTVTIEAAGFQKYERTGITFHAGDRISLPDTELKVATAAEQVEVVASSVEVIPVDTGEKAQVITSKQIDNLSVLGRSADELLKILPGVVYNDPDTPAGFTVQFNRGIGNYNVAGTRNTQIANISDGANVIDPGCNCGSAVTPNVDMLQEVKVQTSNFAAENSLGPVVFSAVSKSGTSEFHGEAYLYARHHSMNSRDWRNNFFDTKKPTDSFYFPGFNIGGPLTKGRDKLFFFAGVEIQRQNHDLGVRPATVPTQAMRAGDFSDTAYLGSLNGYDANSMPKNDEEGNNNWSGVPITAQMLQGGKINPAFINKGGSILLNLLPLPNQDPTKSAGYNYTSNIINPEHRHQQLARVDYNISDNTKLYTRFNHEYQSSPYPFTLWWYNSNDVPWPGDLHGGYNTWSSSTSLVNVLDPSTTNEVVFAYTYWSMNHKIRQMDKVSRSSLGYPYRGIFKNTTDVIPNFTDWGGGVADFIQPGGLDDPTIIGNKPLISIRDNFSKVIGTHTMKFGGFYEFVGNDEPTTANDHGEFQFTNWGGNSTGNAYADMLLGLVGAYDEATKNVTGYFRKHEFSGYAQDSWKVSRKLTLEYGARFMHQGWMYEKNGYMFGFDARRYDPNSQITDYTGLVSPHLGWDGPRSIWKTPALLVSPRFGFAWDVTGRGNTVIRGGGGVFKYADRNGDVFGTIGNPPLRRTTDVCCGLLIQDLETREPGIAKSNLTVLQPNEDKVPTTYSWSFTLSQRLPTSTVFEASYVANSSSHQMVCTNCGADLNAVPEGAMLKAPPGSDPNSFRPFQNYGSIGVRSHGLSQNYHSLQVTANRQTGRVNYSAAYTFSKAMGIGGDSFGTPSDPFDRKGRSYGILPYDRTHGLSVAYNILLPGSFRNPAAKAALNGWQVSGISQWQSGGPLGYTGQSQFRFSGTLADGLDWSDQRITGTNATPARPWLICDPRDGLADGQYANAACFVAPLVGANGTYRMPYMKTPAFQNHDLSVFKNWEFTEHQKLQFRFSMYNFPNHPLPFFNGGADPGLALDFENGVPSQETLEKFGRPTLKRGRRLMQFAIKYYF
jgi:hypothetical protein